MDKDELKRSRKETKDHLKICCRGVLEEYAAEVEFTPEESVLFKCRYLS